MAPDAAQASRWERSIARQVSGDTLPVFQWVDTLYVARRFPSGNVVPVAN
jgi:hypothetical protein